MPAESLGDNLTLEPGEQVLWSGRPDPKAPFFSPIDGLAVPFSLVWEGLTFSILFFALRNHSTNTDRTFVVWVFAVIGVYFVAGRFLYKRWLRRRARYFVTNQRVLVTWSLRRAVVDQAHIRDVDEVSRRSRGDDIGTIIFGTAPLSQRCYGETGLEPLGGVPRNAVPVFSDTSDPEGAMRAFEAGRAAV